MRFLPTLALILITLKLMGVVGLSWFWVLSPIWMPILLFIVVVLIACFTDERGRR